MKYLNVESSRRARGRAIGVCWSLLIAFVGQAQAAPLPLDQTLYDVTFGAGTFVAVGGNGTIFSSAGGGPWEVRASGTTSRLEAVGYGGGVFVAAGEHGALLSSPDGSNWTVRDVRAVLSTPDIAYGNGRFVVSGKGPAGRWTILVSANGADWVTVSVEAPGPSTAPDGMPFGGVTFGAGKFLAVGGVQGANLFLTSTDGLTWIEQGAVGAVGGNNGAAKGPIEYRNGQFALVANYYVDDDDDDDGGSAGYFDRLMVSEDGVSWLPNGPGNALEWRAVAIGGCTLVLAAANPSIPTAPSSVWVSHAGGNWYTSSQMQPGIAVNAMAYGDGKFVGVGTGIVPLNIPPPPGPEFAIWPADISAEKGNYVSFQVAPACLDPLVRLQWKHNGVDVPGATNSYLQFQPVTPTDAGDYLVVARNAAGQMATSTVATLTVTTTIPEPEAPVIWSPVGDGTSSLSLGSDNTLGVSATAWPPPTYQWLFNGINIPGATNTTLSLLNITASAAGNYTVVVSNELGTATSPVMSVALLASPPFSGPPFQVAITAVEGGHAYFPAFGFGSSAPPGGYQVVRNGASLALPISVGTASGSLVLRQVALSDAGEYFFVESNRLGSATIMVVSLAVRPGGPLDRWTQRSPLPQSDGLLDVTAGDGRFVAVGQRSAILSSANGTDWLLHRLRAEAELTGVTHGNGLFVAVGGGNILTSSDGMAWTTRLTRAALILQTAAFGNGRFVAAGGDTILTSSDGLDWADATFPVTGYREFRDLAFGSGRFVAAGAGYGYSQSVWTSVNGTDWSPLSNGPTVDLESLTFGNGQFVAVGADGVVFTSPDGLAWTLRNSGVSSRLLGVAFGDGRYVAVGTRGRLLSSANGVTWTRENSGTPDRLESVTFANGVFVAVGENGTMLSSANGSAWFKRNKGSTRDLDGLTLGGGLLVVAGKGGTVLTSSNGADFTEQRTDVTNDLHGVAWGSGLYVAVGEPGTILTSPNAVQWTPRVSGSSSSLKGGAWGGGRWVAVGTQGEILTSGNGTAWTPAVSFTANDLNGVAYGNGLFVAVGDNLPPNGTLLTSPDGLTWTRRNQYIGKNLRSVTFVNNQFVATANDGRLLASTNGIDWGTHLVNNGNNLRAATYAAGVWMVAGNSGLILTSSDTADWNPHSVPTLDNLHGVVYFGGHFVTIGNRGTILQSDLFLQPAQLAGSRVAGGFELSLTGDVGVSYRVQASERLLPPEWTTLRTFTLLQATTNFVDPIGPPFSGRFYRAVSP